MPEQPDDWRTGLQQRVVDEIDHVIHEFRPSPGEGVEIKAARGDNRVDHLYAEGQILVRDEYLSQVLEILELPGEAELRAAGRIRRIIAGVVLLTLDESRPAVLDALEVIDERLGRGIATPDHVLTVSPQGGVCPATEPQQTYEGIEPYPSVGLSALGLLRRSGARIHAQSLPPQKHRRTRRQGLPAVSLFTPTRCSNVHPENEYRRRR